jgi:NAD(P)H-dependent FMN reductase
VLIARASSRNQADRPDRVVQQAAPHIRHRAADAFAAFILIIVGRSGPCGLRASRAGSVSTRLPGPVRTLADRILAADALLIVTPEYNFSIPGGLKSASGWLSRDPREPLRGRLAAVAGATLGTGGTRRAQTSVRHVLHGLGAHCLPVQRGDRGG